MMRFEHPWLLLLLLVVPAIALWRRLRPDARPPALLWGSTAALPDPGWMRWAWLAVRVLPWAALVLAVVAAARPRMIGAEHVAPGAVVVDVGIHRLDPDPAAGPEARPRLCGDVRFEEVEPIAAAISPVPGGVGPMTVAMLLVNTVVAWCRRHGLEHGLDDLVP